MTGFARASGGDDGASWAWEVRSVNARGLDIRTKLPPGFEGFEVAVRQAVGQRFKRGAVSASLTTTRTAAPARLRINRELLDEVIRLQKDLGRIVDQSPPALAGLLGVRGIVESVDEEETEEARAAREAAMRGALDQALAGLAEMRAAEGARLAAVLADQLDNIARL
ncbi:MAG: YicC/YloC family endoribonuclease, partial [Candidatus Eiseniibacteriota bacterium]